MAVCHICLCLSLEKMEDMLTVDLLYVQHLCTAVKEITRKQKEETWKPFFVVH